MDNKIELIKNRIIDLGCDCWVNDDNFVLFKDGFIKTLPINNTLNLIGGIYPMTIDAIAKLCIDQHQTSKDLDEGKYNNFVGKTTKEMLSEIFKNNKI
ncbi:MAG: hypothetical protein ACO3LF_06930 [Candidatus Kariarchaeum pelagius]